MRCDLKTYLVAIAICALCFVIAATLAQPSPASAKLTENPVYKEKCAKCHEKTAEGRHFGGPSLLSEKAAASVEDLRKIITDGKGRMPKYAGKLAPEEIDNLVQQIRALNGK
jgi:mono/diheme cytochrome c family protein